MSTLAAVRTAAADIKLAHSVFALPFALLGAVLARPGSMPWPAFAGVLALVVVCMVCARTWAMMVNRLADRGIDARNARTARRALASGRLDLRAAGAITLGAALTFIAACSLFGLLNANWWPLALSVPVLAWIALYSFTKRFTALCHVFLGSALAISPLAAAIAVDPAALGRTPALYLVSGMVLFWVAGFDVIYALQDVAFDRSAGLYSVPSRLGVDRAIWLSRAMHAVAFTLLVAAWRLEPRLGVLFGGALVAVAGLLIAEHAVLAKRGEAGLEMAFFTLNGVVSCVLGAAGVIDLLA
jgi:4-hydroxybenzoate polyprenyltransferase